MRIGRWIGALALAGLPPAALGCGTGTAPPPEPEVESEEQLAEVPSMPISQLLGKRRADIETLFHPSQPGHAEGWVEYNQHLEVRYEQDRCAELIQLVPGSIKHKLGPGVSGELTLEGGVFRARLDR
jgi:hypothetical protein